FFRLLGLFQSSLLAVIWMSEGQSPDGNQHGYHKSKENCARTNPIINETCRLRAQCIANCPPYPNRTVFERTDGGEFFQNRITAIKQCQDQTIQQYQFPQRVGISKTQSASC